MFTFGAPSDTNLLKTAQVDASLNRSAGTYDVLTATGGDIYILSLSVKTTTAASGLTSAVMQTNNTTANILMVSTLLVNLTGDKVLAQVNTPFVLEIGKKIQLTIVGVGSGGNLRTSVLYIPVTSGAVLS